jgi:hypothetical protein
MLAGLDRVLFRRQAERVPAHWMQHVETTATLESRQDIRRRVTLRVPDVQTRAARIGKHIEHVKLRLRGIKIRFPRTGSAECFFRVPTALPLGFKNIKRKWFATLGHDSWKVQGRQIGGFYRNCNAFPVGSRA